MPVRGVRGATTVARNQKEEILERTRELLVHMLEANGIRTEDIASAWLTTTPDLYAEFPAVAARQLGWTQVPLMQSHEMSVPGMLPLCIRVLLHWNTEKAQSEIRHIYLREAAHLRPDLAPNTT
jgi:chorismate mutase